MAYIELRVAPKGDYSEDWFDILTAFISDLPFDTFQEQEGEGVAYASKENWEDIHNSELLSMINALPFALDFELKEIEKQNWNETWESKFEPVSIDDDLFIRASFHPSSDQHKINLQITPKMSFGTGHHKTTELICRFLLRFPLENKKVLDAGTGSGILAILSKMLGASSVEAFDIEDWCVENSLENAQANGVELDAVFQGTIENASVDRVDLLIANINRNVLLQEFPDYHKRLKSKGFLVLSGFYVSDNESLIEKAAEFGMELQFSNQLDNWSCLVFKSE